MNKPLTHRQHFALELMKAALQNDKVDPTREHDVLRALTNVSAVIMKIIPDRPREVSRYDGE